MRKKVCVFLWNNFINDARVRREVEALIEAQYEVTVICTYDGDEQVLFEVERLTNCKIKRVWNFTAIRIAIKQKRVLSKLDKVFEAIDKIKIGKIINSAMVLLNMISEGAKERFDFYHCNDLKTLPQGVICNKLFNRKAFLIYDAHEVETSRAGGKSKVKYILEKYLIKYIDKMLMTTKTRAEYTAKLYNIQEPVVIHNYPVYKELNNDKGNLYELIRIPKEEFILLYQGGIQIGRGLEKLIEAAPYFEKGHLVFLGDGSLKQKLMQLTRERNLKHKISFINKVPAEELLNYTQHAYLGFQVLENTCFNHYSALSNKLLEYIMAEIPVICSNLPEMHRIVEKEQVGICIDTSSVEQLIKAVNYLTSNIDLYEQLKANCKKTKYKYNWNEEKIKFVQVYDELMKGK